MVLPFPQSALPTRVVRSLFLTKYEIVLIDLMNNETSLAIDLFDQGELKFIPIAVRPPIETTYPPRSRIDFLMLLYGKQDSRRAKWLQNQAQVGFDNKLISEPLSQSQVAMRHPRRGTKGDRCHYPPHFGDGPETLEEIQAQYPNHNNGK